MKQCIEKPIFETVKRWQREKGEWVIVLSWISFKWWGFFVLRWRDKSNFHENMYFNYMVNFIPFKWLKNCPFLTHSLFTFTLFKLFKLQLNLHCSNYLQFLYLEIKQECNGEKIDFLATLENKDILFCKLYFFLDNFLK